jgi:hypothetical protein
MAVAQNYKSMGYNFIIITDHNYLTKGEGINLSNFLLINGEEVTLSATHYCAYRLSRVIIPSNNIAQRWLDSINAQNAIGVLNHPRWSSSWYTYSMIMALQNLTHFEILNAITETPGALWDSLLTQGNRTFYGLATDDSHYSFLTDLGWIMVKSGALQRDSILKNIRNGNFYSSNGISIDSMNYNQTSIYVKFSTNCSNIKFIGKNGTIYKQVSNNVGSYSFTGAEKYIRIYASNLLGTSHAWTQPVYVNPVYVESSQIPVKFALHQNYPNPFNPETKISFDIPENGFTNLKIYNILGIEVAEPLNKLLKAGSHTITFNASNLSTGVYFYKIITGDYSDIKQMMFVK